MKWLLWNSFWRFEVTIVWNRNWRMWSFGTRIGVTELWIMILGLSIKISLLDKNVYEVIKQSEQEEEEPCEK